MAPRIPHEIKNIRALIQHFVDSETEGSVYSLKMETQGSYTVFSIEYKYVSGNYNMLLKASLKTWPKTEEADKKFRLAMRLETDPFQGTEKSSEAIEYAGIFIKMGNLMHQIQGLV